MKIKAKKPFGEKHRVRRPKAHEKQRARNEKLAHEKQRAHNEKLIERNQKLIDSSRERLADYAKQHQEFLDRQPWYQRIRELRANDPCEIFDQSEWRAAIFVAQIAGSAACQERWGVRDAQGNRLRALYVRQSGDQEAWPESEEIERKLADLGISPPAHVVKDPDPDTASLQANGCRDEVKS